MNKKQLMVAVVLTFICTVGQSSSAQAFRYSVNKALFFTYEAKRGAWKACGPNNCTSLSHESEEAAKSDVRDKYRHGTGDLIAHFGKCRIYQGDTKVTGGDNPVSWVVEKLDGSCY